MIYEELEKYFSLLWSTSNQDKEAKEIAEQLKSNEVEELNTLYIGRNPLLSLACLNYKSTNQEIIQILLEKGVDPNLKHIEAKSTLAWLITSWINSDSPLLEIFQLFLNRGAKPDLQTSKEDSPLIDLLQIEKNTLTTLKQKEWGDLLEIFLDKKPDLNHVTSYGATPLLMACAFNPEVVTLLTEREADIDFMFSSILTNSTSKIEFVGCALSAPKDTEMVKKFTDSFFKNLVFTGQGIKEEKFIEIVSTVLRSELNNGVFLLKNYFEEKNDTDQSIFVRKVLNKLFDIRHVELNSLYLLTINSKVDYFNAILNEKNKKIVTELLNFMQGSPNPIQIEEADNDCTKYFLKSYNKFLTLQYISNDNTEFNIDFHVIGDNKIELSENEVMGNSDI